MSLTQTFLRSTAVAALASPHGVDRYLEIANPMWAVNEVRARVVRVQQETAEVTTLTHRPTSTWRGFRAGQNVLLAVDIGGARRTTRCFSISSAEQSATARAQPFTITVRAHEEGLVSQHLATEARPGLVVHLSRARGDFTLPDPLPRRLLMISGGSGITPLMSMLRTLVEVGYDGHIRFVHYSQSPELTIFREELERVGSRANVELSVVHTRTGGQRFSGTRLAELAPDYADTDTFACGPAGLVEQVQQAYAAADAVERLNVEHFKTSTIRTDPDDVTGTVSFTCTARKNEGTVRNLLTGAESSRPDEDIAICVTTPAGDCAVDLRPARHHERRHHHV